MKKHLSITSILIGMTTLASAQCATYPTAVSDITLQCTFGTGNRTAVAYYPTKNTYYSVNAGSPSYPIETFTVTGGAAVTPTVTQAADYRGLWYNSNLGTIEGNAFNSVGIFRHDINQGTGYAIGTVSNVAAATMPNSQSSGAYDPVNNHVLYYNGGSLYKYDRATGALVTSMAITGLPAGSINTYGIIYTGIPGEEVGVYDYTNLAVRFINFTTGAYVSSCQLPVGAPNGSGFRFSYANNRVFLYNGSGSWFGYKITNQADLIFTGNNISCSGQSVTINVSGASSYTWSNGSNATSISVAPASTTIYSVAVTNTANCVSSSNFVVSTGTTPSMSTTATNTFLCGGGSATLTASGATTYSWNTGATSSSVTVTPSVTTVYTVTGTNSSACDAITTITLTVENNPTVSIVGSNTICEGTTASLTANGASSYTWNSGSNLQTIAISPTVVTAYTVTGSSAGGCTGSNNAATISVTPSPAPVVNAVSSTSMLCAGQSATLTASGANTYSWSSGSTSSTAVISPTTTTIYSVTGTNTLGCPGTYTLVQNVSPCTGIESVTSLHEKISVSPNPGTGKYSFYYTGNKKDALIRVLDMTGKLILEQKVESDITTIDISSFEKGIYFAIISSNGQTATATKIIQQ